MCRHSLSFFLFSLLSSYLHRYIDKSYLIVSSLIYLHIFGIFLVCDLAAEGVAAVFGPGSILTSG